jgi:hypothetical protein
LEDERESSTRAFILGVVVFMSLLIRAAYTTFITVLTIQQNGDTYCPLTVYINRDARVLQRVLPQVYLCSLHTPPIFLWRAVLSCRHACVALGHDVRATA